MGVFLVKRFVDFFQKRCVGTLILGLGFLFNEMEKTRKYREYG